MVERLQRSADFERVLRTPIRARSTHFAAHHLGDAPSRPEIRKLSTRVVPLGKLPVDDSPPAAPLAGLWLGAVVPKRHARRSVTRSLLKRQIRSAVAESADALSAGLWVIRLRAPFDVALFPSARSQALRDAARGELQQLLASAAAQRARAH